MKAKLTLLCAAAFCSLPFLGQAKEKPNILFLVGDDIGFGDLGISGSITKTPNLDHLAKQGTFFTNFHVSPVCSVTRSMLLTGNNPIEVGLGAFDYAIYPPSKGKPGYEGYLKRNAAMISEILQDAGYHTSQVGKWHLGGPGHGGWGPEEWGFDRSYGLYTGGANHWNQGPFHVNMQDPEVQAKLKKGELPEEPYHENAKTCSIVSAIGANSQSSNYYNQTKGEAEELLKGLGLNSLRIFRPSLLYGNRGEFRLKEAVGTSVLRILSPLLLGSLRKYRAIHVEQVAKAMQVSSRQDYPAVQVFESNQIQRF